MTTSYDIALTRTLRRHPFWGSTASNPWCACGWDGPGEGVVRHLVYSAWIAHVVERVERERADIERYGVDATSTVHDDAPDHVPTGP